MALCEVVFLFCRAKMMGRRLSFAVVIFLVCCYGAWAIDQPSDVDYDAEVEDDSTIEFEVVSKERNS